MGKGIVFYIETTFTGNNLEAVASRIAYYTPPSYVGGFNWATDDKGSFKIAYVNPSDYLGLYLGEEGVASFLNSFFEANNLSYPANASDYFSFTNQTTTTQGVATVISRGCLDNTLLSEYVVDNTLYKVSIKDDGDGDFLETLDNGVFAGIEAYLGDPPSVYNAYVGTAPDDTAMDSYITWVTSVEDVPKPRTIKITGVTQSKDSGTTTVTVNAYTAYSPLTYSKDGSTYQSSNQFAITTEGLYTFYAKDDEGDIDFREVYVFVEAYGTLYRSDIQDDYQLQNIRFDIQEKSYSGAITELNPTGNPLFLNYQKKGDLVGFQGIKGSTVNFSAFSPSNFAFLDLFQSEWDKYKGVIKKNYLVPNFDGTDDYFSKSVSNFRGSDSQGTIWAWVELDDVTSVNIINIVDNTPANNVFGLSISSTGKVSLSVRAAGAVLLRLEGTTTISTATKYLLVWQNDGTASNANSIFINNVDDSATPVASADDGEWIDSIGATTKVVIGVDENNASGYAQGKIYQIGYTNQILSASQLTELYNGGTINDPKTLTFYDNLLHVWQPDKATDSYIDLKGVHNLSSNGSPTYLNSGFNFYETIWEGFLSTEQYQESYVDSSNYDVNFLFSDGLGKLRDEQFTDDAGRTIDANLSLLEVIQTCLNKTGLQLNLNVICKVFDSKQVNTDDKNEPLIQTYINTKAFEDKSCYEIIEEICKLFFAQIYQHKGEWWFTRFHEIEGTAQVVKYGIGGDYISTYQITDSASITSTTAYPLLRFIDQSQSLSMIQAIKKINIKRTLPEEAEFNINGDFEILDSTNTSGIKGWSKSINSSFGKDATTDADVLNYNIQNDYEELLISDYYPYPQEIANPQSKLKLSFRSKVTGNIDLCGENKESIVNRITLRVGRYECQMTRNGVVRWLPVSFRTTTGFLTVPSQTYTSGYLYIRFKYIDNTNFPFSNRSPLFEGDSFTISTTRNNYIRVDTRISGQFGVTQIGTTELIEGSVYYLMLTPDKVLLNGKDQGINVNRWLPNIMYIYPRVLEIAYAEGASQSYTYNCYTEKYDEWYNNENSKFIRNLSYFSTDFTWAYEVNNISTLIDLTGNGNTATAGGFTSADLNTYHIEKNSDITINEWTEEEIELPTPPTGGTMQITFYNPYITGENDATAPIKTGVIDYVKLAYISGAKATGVNSIENTGRYKLEKTIDTFISDTANQSGDVISLINQFTTDSQVFSPCTSWREAGDEDSDNLWTVIDGTFETGITGITAGTGVSISQSTTQAYAGTYSLKCEKTGDFFDQTIFQIASQIIEPNFTYRLQGRVYIERTGTELGKPKIIFKPVAYSVNAVNVSSTNATATGYWYLIDCVFDRGPYTDTNIQCYLINGWETGTTTLYFDDLKLIKVPQSSTLIGLTAERILNAYSRPRQKLNGRLAYNGVELSLITNLTDPNNSGKVFLPNYLRHDFKSNSYDIELQEIISKTNISPKLLDEQGFPLILEDGGNILLE